jgi:hypothetical protein
MTFAGGRLVAAARSQVFVTSALILRGKGTT